MAAVGKLTDQTFPRAQHSNNGVTYFAFSVELDGSNDPTNQAGDNAKVTRAAAGVYDIELPKKYAQMVACLLTMEDATDVDAYAQVVSYTSSTKTVRVRVQDLTSEDVTDLDGPRLNVMLVMRLNSNLSRTWS